MHGIGPGLDFNENRVATVQEQASKSPAAQNIRPGRVEDLRDVSIFLTILGWMNIHLVRLYLHGGLGWWLL
jgi:hypothetical protein